MLKLVKADPVICAPWHLRGSLSSCADDGRHPAGSVCDECGRNIAIPRALQFRPALCLYCGMEAGLVPLIELDPGG